MGKTNLLDAIYCLALTKSYFSGRDQQLVRQGASFFRLHGSLAVGEDAIDLVLKYQPGRRKVLERGGVPYEKLADHIGSLSVVFITPDDIDLINGTNEIRRRFIDHTICLTDRDYLHRLMVYNRLLKQRNALLRQGLEQGQHHTALLDTYADQMSPAASYIYQRRLEFFTQFNPSFNHHYQVLSEGMEEVTSTYEADQDEQDFRQGIAAKAKVERATGRTMVGPHRDKMMLRLMQMPAKSFASQGQKKSIVLAMKLAQYALICQRTGDRPILLLDDIFDRLDHRRVDQLLQTILNPNFGQIFITDTQLDRVLSMISDREQVQTIEIQSSDEEQ